MILKFINLKQAHTNTIYNILEKKLYCQIRNVWKNISVKLILKSKIVSGSKVQKLKTVVLEIALDQ